MKNEITLHWEEKVTLKELKNPLKSDISGVYIWGFTIDSKFIPYYVGSSDTIFKRICEHVASIMTGKYTMYHKDSLADFSKYKSEGVSNNEKGKVYCPNWPESFVDFLAQREELQPHIDFMIDNFSCTYAKVESKEYLKNVEGQCISAIGKANLCNDRQPNPGDVLLCHEGNSTITDFINSHKKLTEK